MNSKKIPLVAVAVLSGILAFHGRLAVYGGFVSPVVGFAEKIETHDAVIYRAEPEDPPGARQQRKEEERKEAASWEMLRRLTIEIERPNSFPEPSFPTRPKTVLHP